MIIDQLLFLQNNLSAWAKEEAGVCKIASDLNHMWYIGNMDYSFPSLILAYESETTRGPDDTKDVTGKVDRNFQCMVVRARGMTADRGEGLVNTVVQSEARPFYSLLEEARDIIRGTIMSDKDSVAPILINGIKAVELGGMPLDSYIISFTIITDIGVILYREPELGGSAPVDTDNRGGFRWTQNQG